MTHAAEARERGYQVVHLEREPGSRGATVRNFGLVWVSGRARGPELALALRARQLWEQLAGRVPDIGIPRARLADPGYRRCRGRAARRGRWPARRGGAGLPAARRGRGAPRQPGPAGRVHVRAARRPGRHRRATAGTERDPRLPAGQRHLGGVRLAARTGGGRDRARSRPRPHRSLAPRRPGRAVHGGGPHRASPARICPATPGRRCAGSGCRCCKPSRSTAALTTSRRRRRHAALLPCLRPARPWPARAPAPGRRGRRRAAAAGAAAGRQPHDRGHPRL